MPWTFCKERNHFLDHPHLSGKNDSRRRKVQRQRQLGEHMDIGEGGEDVGKEDGAEDEEDGVDLPSAGLWKSLPPTDNQT